MTPSAVAALAAAGLAAASPPGSPASQVFGWREGVVYEVTARPGRVTDIVLEPGEALSPVNPVAAGDTVRWIIGDSESGEGAQRQTHILVKPVEAGLATSLFIATTRRTYHLDLRSTAGSHMATVAWRYPEAELAALRRRDPQPAAAPPPADPPHAAPEADLAKLNFGYRIEGQAPFRPLRVFDDGRRMVIDFPDGVAAGEMPPLFELGEDDVAQLVNYRVLDRRIVVDRLLTRAELRLGAGKRQARVRILRVPGPARP